MTTINDLHVGSPFSASDQNTVRRQVREYTPFVGGRGINVKGTPGGGKTISLAGPSGVLQTRLGKIVAPSDPTMAFTDERYWVNAQFTNQLVTDDYKVELVFADDGPATVGSGQSDPFPIVATNLCEVGQGYGISGSHLLWLGTMIQYFPAYDPFGVKRWVFWQAPQRIMMVGITGTGAGGGAYTGVTFQATGGDISAGTGVTDSSFGSTDEDAIILNALEVDKGTHDIDPGSSQHYFIGFLLQRNSDGTPVVVINGFQTEDCT
jgi:hypothetical protein